MNLPTPSETDSRGLVGRTLMLLAGFVIVVAGMRASSQILVPFLLATFIAVISAPPMFFLKRKGAPTAVALALVIFGILGLGFGFAGLIGSSLDSFYRDLPQYQARLQDQTRGLVAYAARWGISAPGSTLIDQFDPGAAMQLVANVLKGLSGVLANTFLILITVVFMLLEASSFPAKLRRILGDPEASLARFDEFVEKVQRYMAIKTTVSLATGIAIAGWMALLGVDYPVLWGVLAFLLNYVPNIGSIIAAVPAILLATVQLGLGSAALTGLGFLVVNLVMGSVIEPRFMGRGLGLSTLVVFLSLVFWGWVLGPVGMLLSVPLTMTLKIALESNAGTHGMAILLGPPPREEPVPAEGETLESG